MAIPTYPLKIKQIKRVAKDSADFIFEVPTEHKSLFYYRPAQFLTFEFLIKGQSFLRSYSISSCPLLNEPLQTTVKRVKGGVISNYMIDHLKEGDTLMSRKPAGRFFKAPADLKPKHYFLFAGGSGITPLFSILKTALLSDPKNKVTLFYANRTESSVIYLQQLRNWLNQHPKRLHITWILSQPADSSLLHHIKGRLQKNHLSTYFSSNKTGSGQAESAPRALPFEQNATLEAPHPGRKSFQHKDFQNLNPTHKNHLYYLCGPVGFMDTVQNFLIESQVAKQKIRKENFLSLSQRAEPSVPHTTPDRQKTEEKKPRNELDSSGKDNSAHQTKNEKDPPLQAEVSIMQEPELRLKGKEGESEKAPPETIKACIDGEEIHIPAEAHIPILEQLLSQGHSPPFSCLSGSCMSCLAVLKKGQIIQEEKGILEEENIKNYEILTCQAKPESRLVEVDYSSSS